MVVSSVLPVKILNKPSLMPSFVRFLTLEAASENGAFSFFMFLLEPSKITAPFLMGQI